jgi:hypothetical protein
MSETLSATIGWSALGDAKKAGIEAAETAAHRFPSGTPALAIVFGSSWFEQEPLLAGVRSVLGEVPLVGESTAGEIVPDGPVSHSCVVLLLGSPSMACGVGVGESVDRQPREAGQQAAYAAAREFRGSTRSGLLLFGDGLLTCYADVVRGVREVLGTSFLIAGGMAGDDLRFDRTYQYGHKKVLSRSVVCALLGGSLKIGVGIEHGFAPISKPRRITRSRGNVLIQLDRQPAAAVYEEYFGADLVKQLRAEGMVRQTIVYPLGIQCGSDERWLLRNVISFGDDGSLACSGEITEGSWLQLMMGSRELALEAAHRAAQQAVRSLNRLGCVLVFDSAARRRLLGPEHAAREIARIRQAVGPSVPLAGCYTYGEQAPFGTTATYEQTATQTGSVLVVAIGT